MGQCNKHLVTFLVSLQCLQRPLKCPLLQLRKDLHTKENEEEASIISNSGIGDTLGYLKSTNYELNGVPSFFQFKAMQNMTFCGTHRR